MRYSIVQGPRQSFYNAYSGACRIFALSLFFDRAAEVYEDGRQVRDFVNIADVAAANALVLESAKADFEVYNVGGGRAYTVAEFYDCVREVYKSKRPATISGQFRFGDTRHICSDIAKLEQLGWAPRFGIKKSVEDYVKYLRAQENIDDILEYASRKMKSLNVVQQAQLRT
jgi:dTDP-L-rhamnose 4-epimerase